MISIGNDIVSLKSARSNRFTQKEYYSKILSQEEQSYFNNKLKDRLSFTNYVWLLWTIKESIYKFCKRRDNDLLFNPLKIIVHNIDLPDDYFIADNKQNIVEDLGFQAKNYFDCEVDFQGNNIYAKSLITEDYIFSITTSQQIFFEKIYWGIKQIDSTDHSSQSSEVRKFVIEKIKNLCSNQDVEIKKQERVPYVLIGGTQSDILLSLTHHENYIAYSFLLSDE